MGMSGQATQSKLHCGNDALDGVLMPLLSDGKPSNQPLKAGPLAHCARLQRYPFARNPNPANLAGNLRPQRRRGQRQLRGK
jgi:hypothetical protein